MPGRIVCAMVIALILVGATGPVAAQGTLNVYCSVQLEWCQTLANEFTRQSGIKVAITNKGSGEVFAQIKAEAGNPKADAWFGGTGDPHLQAAEESLTTPYRSPNLAQLHPWAVKQAEQSGYRTVGIYMGALGFSYNTELFKKKGLTPPRCWADLLQPARKVEKIARASDAPPPRISKARTMNSANPSSPAS